VKGLFYGGDFSVLKAQAIGTFTIAIAVFVVTWIMMKLIMQLPHPWKLRVEAHGETGAGGLDMFDHGAIAYDYEDGDVNLTSVATHVLHTTVMSRGSVSREPTPHHGKTVDLQASVQGGRINDVMLVLIKSKVAPMTGSLQVNTSIRLPPGPAPFLKRLSMAGDFHISGAEFTKEARRLTLDQLSASAAGRKVNSDAGPGTVLSNLHGHCVVKDGVATLSNVTFQIPGSSAGIRGTFDLITQQLNFQGNLQTEGELSDTQKGIKKIFVKVAVAIHKHRSPQHLIPFKITGQYGDPKFALNDDPQTKKRQ
jgi:hypothetical protein